jgi:hypothetical protein
MFTVRPVLGHFLLWLALAPLFFFEAQALDQLFQTIALQDSNRVRFVQAEVTDQRHGSRGYELRYQFQVAGSDQTFHAMNTSGWGEVWIPVTHEVWAAAARGEPIRVAYLPEHPAANQPVGRVGYPIGDSAFSWVLFVLVDLIWLAETCFLVINFQRCLAAVERREEFRGRFWRSQRLPTAIEHYARSVRPVRGVRW